MHELANLLQAIAVFIGAVVGLLSAFGNFRKNKHQEEQDTVKNYQQLYEDIKIQLVEARKEIDQLQAELNKIKGVSK